MLTDSEIDVCYALRPDSLSKRLEYTELVSKNACVAVPVSSALSKRNELYLSELDNLDVCIAPLYNSEDYRLLKRLKQVRSMNACTYDDFINEYKPDSVYITSGYVDFDSDRYKLIPITDLKASYGMIYRAKEKTILWDLIGISEKYFQERSI